jgi:small subunit ribosomal protein S6
LRFYETTIVLSPQAEETVVAREIEKITQAVSRADGRLVTTQRWGVKRMAYPIQKHSQANYVHFVYQAPPAVPGELEAAFRINESILRHLTVLVEGPLPTRKSGEEQETAEAVPVAGSAPAAAPAPEPESAPAPAPVAAPETDPATESTDAVAVVEAKETKENE